MSSMYKNIWELKEKESNRPLMARSIIEIEYQTFENQIRNQSKIIAKKTIESLYDGDIYILKNAFSKEFMGRLLDSVYEAWQGTPSQFHKMVEGCPDYHRQQDEEIAKKYVFESVRHSYYWFHWNGDPLGVIPEINKRWRVIKLLGGLDETAYEKNTPKDGIIDRFQVARYLPGIGRSETHSDPYENQRLFISAFMSKKGVHYRHGGFYVVNNERKEIDVEPFVDIGDLAIGYATVLHGVGTVDPKGEVDWKSKSGRWWLGLYSNSTDEVKNRAVGVAMRNLK